MKPRFIITLEELQNVPVPQQTNTYKPVAHDTLVQLTLEGSDKAGFQLLNQEYRASGDGKIATAHYDFAYGDDEEIGLRIAWQNSYNKQVSLKFAIGANVFVCENGMFSGDIGAFKKKHVGEVQTVTPETVQDYFNNAETIYSGLSLSKKKLKDIELGRKKVAAIVGDMYINKGLLKETQIAIVKKEIEKPTFDYKADGTAWQLYNHITYALKTLHPSEYIDSHVAVNNYFTKQFDL